MSNKKIFKLVISMIVVSLGIIGISYLFFSSNSKVNNNSKDISSVIYIKQDYMFNINNIMPGWKNDGITYIDNGSNVSSKLLDGESFDNQDFVNSHPNYYGVMKPLEIEINNKNKENISFKISIDNIKTNIIDQESEATDQNGIDLGYTKNNSDNLIITIYINDISNENIIYSEKCTINNELFETKNVFQNTGKTKYYIVIEYKQAVYNQSDGLNINLSGKINVNSSNNTKMIHVN